MMLKNAPGSSTSIVSQLDKQIIAQVNLLIPNNPLVSFTDLNVVAGGNAVWPLLQKDAKAALQRAINERGQTLVVNSAYRTIAQQFFLFINKERLGIPKVAPVGKSNHQSGLALDIEDHEGWKPYLKKYGWQWFGPSDSVHFSFGGEGNPNAQSGKIAAIKAFQKLWNLNNPDRTLTVDGDVGPMTLARLGESPIEGFSKGDKSSVNPLWRVLRLTAPLMQGEDVRELQQALIKMNFNLDADGFFGTTTDVAIKKFQQDKDLIADGVVGLVTLKRMGLL